MPQQLPISSMSLHAKVIEHAALANAMLTKAATQEKQAAATQTAIENAIPGVIDALVQHSRIRPEEREKVATSLRDPVAVLRMMQKLAGHRTAEELGRLGGPAGTVKTASVRRGAVDARSTGVDAATAALYTQLGLAVPQS